jgi:hypothetical protein
MKDLIDLGNLVFNHLIKEHHEIEESRLLFLYGVTTSTKWSVINSNKWILIEPSGLSKNFTDSVLESLDSEWKNLKLQFDKAAIDLKLAKARAEYDRPQPKAGDTFEFWSDSGSFREIKF